MDRRSSCICLISHPMRLIFLTQVPYSEKLELYFYTE
jgi:hypothetical protein